MAGGETGCDTWPRTVLITGVSRGCGRAMVVELARRGHTVIGIARSEEKLASLREECPRPNGQQHFFIAVDVTSDAAVKELTKSVVEDGLVPDIVVNNAAIVNKANKIWKVPCEEVDVVLDTNIKGTINVLRHFLPLMIGKGHGIVVNISSLWGRTVAPNAAPYCTSKWAIEGLSRAVAMDVPTGLAVVALDPGAIYTDLLVTTLGSMGLQSPMTEQSMISIFPTPEKWAPIAIEMILGLTSEDNGTCSTILMDTKTTMAAKALHEEIVDTQNLHFE